MHGVVALYVGQGSVHVVACAGFEVAAINFRLHGVYVYVCCNSDAWHVVPHCVVHCRQGAGGVWDSTERLRVNCGHSGWEEGAEESQVSGCRGR